MFLSVSLSVDVFHISLCVLTETLWFILVLRCNYLTGGNANWTLVIFSPRIRTKMNFYFYETSLEMTRK